MRIGKKLLLMLCLGICIGKVNAMFRSTVPVKRALAGRAFSSRNQGTSRCRHEKSGFISEAGKSLLFSVIMYAVWDVLESKTRVSAVQRDLLSLTDEHRAMQVQQGKMLEQLARLPTQDSKK